VLEPEYRTGLRAINDYFSEYAFKSSISVVVDPGQGMPQCVAPDEGAQVGANTSLQHPFYNGSNTSLTFGLPERDSCSASGDCILGRGVDSSAPAPGADSSAASFNCDFFAGHDLARFDVLVVPGTSARVPASTLSFDVTVMSTVLHELAHMMGLAHEDRFPSLMNTTPGFGGIGRDNLVGLRGFSGANVVAVKGDGDLSQGLYSLGYRIRTSGTLDYGAIALSKIVRSTGLAVAGRRQNITLGESGPVTIPDFGFTVLNHRNWYGGYAVLTTVEDGNWDPAVNQPSGPAFHVATVPLDQYLVPDEAPSQLSDPLRPGNVFLRFEIPIRPTDLANMRAGMVAGKTYRVTLTIFPPSGVNDSDWSDNVVSTQLTIRRH
jgi:hypothetical protein